MDATRLLEIVDRLGHPRLLVVGDVVLDRYTWGDAERVSQEAPVLLLRTARREARLGGAGAVSQMVRGLEAHVALAGVVGNDNEATTVRRLLDKSNIDHECLLHDPSRPTTVKERFMGRAASAASHQVLRVDSEVRRPIDANLQQRLAMLLEDRLDRFDAVLISDYDKGVCTPELLAHVIAAARERGIPVVVDPIRASQGGVAYKRYRGATTMTPNRYEAELATGLPVGSIDDAAAAGQALCRMCRLDYAVITLDRDGMARIDTEGRCEHFPTQARHVYDITGAGDMVLSAIGLALAAGVDARDALWLANVAAGLEVARLGVAVVGRDELAEALAAACPAQSQKIVTLEQMTREARRLRAQGARLVFTNGCFDLLHVGHVRNLQEAAAQGDRLVVALNSDQSVRRLKGPGRPVIGQDDRAALLAALGCVDYVLVFDDDTPNELLRQIKPDVLVKGSGYAPHEVVGHEIVQQYGGRIHLTSHLDGISTTDILRSIRGTLDPQAKPRLHEPDGRVAPDRSAPTAATCDSNTGGEQPAPADSVASAEESASRIAPSTADDETLRRACPAPVNQPKRRTA